MKKLISIITLISIASTAYGMGRIAVSGTIKQYSKSAEVQIYDPSYESISDSTLKKVVGSHSRETRKYAPRFKARNELFDCDDYAFTFKSSVSHYGLMLGSNYLCGVLIVRQDEAFGGIPAGGLHALNVVLIDGVLNVLEPQSYEYVPISEYPNRGNIVSLII